MFSCGAQLTDGSSLELDIYEVGKRIRVKAYPVLSGVTCVSWSSINDWQSRKDPGKGMSKQSMKYHPAPAQGNVGKFDKKPFDDHEAPEDEGTGGDADDEEGNNSRDERNDRLGDGQRHEQVDDEEDVAPVGVVEGETAEANGAYDEREQEDER